MEDFSIKFMYLLNKKSFCVREKEKKEEGAKILRNVIIVYHSLAQKKESIKFLKLLKINPNTIRTRRRAGYRKTQINLI